MTDTQQLPLRDIHLPDAVSWWPPAPGWWGLTLTIVAVTLLSWWLWRRLQRRRSSAFNLARGELLDLRRQYANQHDAQQTIRDISVLLRRVTISAYPRDEAAGLTGADWLRFLDRPLDAAPFSSGTGRILLDAPYRREVVTDEIEPLFQLCEQWLDGVEQRRRERQ